jgi:hypothetical protein
MDRLQDYVDRVFGPHVADRAVQEPNEFAKERARAFAENARKIELLRIARLAQESKRSG